MSEDGLYVHFHGTRGSVPTPERENARYGGNTPCVEVGSTADEQPVLLDAGTGIRRAGQALERLDPEREIQVFLTHFHWDHVQGLPFFGPLHQPGARIRIHAPCQSSRRVSDLFDGLMAPLYFPVPYHGFAAGIRLEALGPGPTPAGGLEIDSLRVQHPSNTHGYRIRQRGVTVAYVPDNELAADEGARRALRDFVRGADLLIHDAMLTEAEYPGRRGWGHSTFRQAVSLAEDAEVRQLRLFHHAPDRNDRELERIRDCIGEELARRGSGLEVALAREGERLFLR